MCEEDKQSCRHKTSRYSSYIMFSTRPKLKIFVGLLCLVLLACMLTIFDIYVNPINAKIGKLKGEVFLEYPTSDTHFDGQVEAFKIASNHHTVDAKASVCSLSFSKAHQSFLDLGSIDFKNNADGFLSLIYIDVSVNEFSIIRNLLLDFVVNRKLEGTIKVACTSDVTFWAWNIIPFSFSWSSETLKSINSELFEGGDNIEHGSSHNTITNLANYMNQFFGSVFVSNVTSDSVQFGFHQKFNYQEYFANYNIDVESLIIHVPKVAYRVEQFKTISGGWELSMDSLNFDILNADTKWIFTLACKGEHDGRPCDLYSPLLTGSDIYRDFEDFNHVNMTANAHMRNFITSFLGQFHWMDFVKQSDHTASREPGLLSYSEELHEAISTGGSCVAINSENAYYIKECKLMAPNFFKLYANLRDTNNKDMATIDSLTSWTLNAPFAVISNTKGSIVNGPSANATFSASETSQTAALIVRYVESSNIEQLYLNASVFWKTKGGVSASNPYKIWSTGLSRVRYQGNAVSFAQANAYIAMKNPSQISIYDFCNVTVYEVSPQATTSYPRVYATGVSYFKVTDPQNWWMSLNSSSLTIQNQVYGFAAGSISLTVPSIDGLNGNLKSSLVLSDTNQEQIKSAYVLDWQIRNEVKLSSLFNMWTLATKIDASLNFNYGNGNYGIEAALYGLGSSTTYNDGYVFCPPYSASNTKGATTSTIPCYITVCPDTYVQISSQSCSANEFYRVLRSDGSFVAAGTCYIYFSPSNLKNCEKYTIAQGCTGDSSCSNTGVNVYGAYPYVNSLPTAQPTSLPNQNIETIYVKGAGTYKEDSSTWTGTLTSSTLRVLSSEVSNPKAVVVYTSATGGSAGYLAWSVVDVLQGTEQYKSNNSLAWNSGSSGQVNLYSYVRIAGKTFVDTLVNLKYGNGLYQFDTAFYGIAKPDENSDAYTQCAPYSTSRTNSASVNYKACDITICPNSLVDIYDYSYRPSALLMLENSAEVIHESLKHAPGSAVSLTAATCPTGTETTPTGCKCTDPNYYVSVSQSKCVPYFSASIPGDAPWGIWRAEYYNSVNSKLYEVRGNGEDADVFSASGIKSGSTATDGATANVNWIGSSSGANVKWLSVPSFTSFTMCAISRYTGPNKNYIISSSDCGFVFGHASGRRGFANFYQYLAYSNLGVSTNWLVMCGTNGYPAVKGGNIIADGLDIGFSYGGRGPNGLGINVCGQSDWAIADVVIWNRVLSYNDMRTVSDSMLASLCLNGQSWDPITSSCKTDIYPGYQYFRLLNSAGIEVAKSPHSQQPRLQYQSTPDLKSCAKFTIAQGCDKNTSCSSYSGVQVNGASAYYGSLPTTSPTPKPGDKPLTFYGKGYGVYRGDWYNWNMSLVNSTFYLWADEVARYAFNFSFITDAYPADGLKMFLSLDVLGYQKGYDSFILNNLVYWDATTPQIESKLHSSMQSTKGAEQYKIDSFLNVDLKKNSAEFMLTESQGSHENLYTFASAAYDMSLGMLTYLKDITRWNGNTLFSATIGWAYQSVYSLRPSPSPTLFAPSPRPSIAPSRVSSQPTVPGQVAVTGVFDVTQDIDSITKDSYYQQEQDNSLAFKTTVVSTSKLRDISQVNILSVSTKTMAQSKFLAASSVTMLYSVSFPISDYGSADAGYASITSAITSSIGDKSSTGFTAKLQNNAKDGTPMKLATSTTAPSFTTVEVKYTTVSTGTSSSGTSKSDNATAIGVGVAVPIALLLIFACLYKFSEPFKKGSNQFVLIVTKFFVAGKETTKSFFNMKRKDDILELPTTTKVSVSSIISTSNPLNGSGK